MFARGWITHLELGDRDPAIRAFFDRLEAHFRVVRYDGRGSGLSDRDVDESITVDDLAEDLRSVVDATCDGEYVLWGSSWAGPAAIVHAATYPERVRELVLEGTYARGAALASPKRRDSFLAMLATAEFQPEAVYAALSYMTDPEPGMSHSARISRVRQSITPQSLVTLYRLLFEMDVQSYLASVVAPTLVVHRSRSKSVPIAAARALAEGIPGAQMFEMPGRAHNSWEGDTAPLFRELASFLNWPALAHDEVAESRSQDKAIVYIDQIGSTDQMRLLGDARGVEVQAEMIEMLLHIAKPFGAIPYSDTGDGTVLFVSSAATAVAMAQVMQRRFFEYNEFALADERILLRIGVHLGAVRASKSGRESGFAIAVASRLCDLAPSQGIVVSDRVRRECEDVVGAIQFAPIDSVHLKGVGELACSRLAW